MSIRGWLWIPIAALALAGPVRAGELEARVDRRDIALGETFELQLRVRGDADAAFDPSPLRTEFDVLDVRRSARTTIVNGRREASTEWRVELAPRRTGPIEIPALRAGAVDSQPLHLEVAPARSPRSPATAGRPPAVSVEAEVSDPAPYVQGRVLLTLRVLAGPSLLDGSLADPEIDGAVVERVGEDRRFRREIAGAPFRGIERQYAVFPQRSGEIRIPPVAFRGRVHDTDARRPRDLFEDVFGPRGRAVSAYSAPLSLDVKPRPQEMAQEWFVPARKVELVERWESPPPVFRVGEPVKRVVAIRATGLSGAQLPELVLPPAEGLKQYSEPAVDETFDVGDDVVAVKAQQTALIPTRPGALTLPALELAWWDTEADQARVARLPARTIQVLPAAGGSPLAAAPGAAASGPPDRDSAPASAVATPPVGDAAQGSWHGLAGTGLGALCLLAAIRLARRRRGDAHGPSASDGADSPSLRRDAERALRQACEAGDAGSASRALAALARSRWPERAPSSGGLARRLEEPEFARAVAELDRVQYSPDAGRWDGSSLWRAYRKARGKVRGGALRGEKLRGGKARGSGAGGALPALYPARSAGG